MEDVARQSADRQVALSQQQQDRSGGQNHQAQADQHFSNFGHDLILKGKASAAAKAFCKLCLSEILVRAGLLLCRLDFGVLAAEALHAPGRIHQLLLASKEWMATGANFDVNITLVGGTGAESAAAGALYADFVIRGMNRCLHRFSKSILKL
jgi:hypothetical protein